MDPLNAVSPWARSAAARARQQLIADDGIDRNRWLACLTTLEFRYRDRAGKRQWNGTNWYTAETLPIVNRAELDALVDVGLLETHAIREGRTAILGRRGVDGQIRLTDAHRLTLLLKAGLLDQWRDQFGTAVLHERTPFLADLLQHNVTAALACDPAQAWYAALVAAVPSASPAEARRLAKGLHVATTEGYLPAVSTLQTLTSLAPFPGSVTELVDTVCDILS